MEIVLIVAMAANRVIGRDNQLPWRLPADLQRFKRLTLGHALIMGRKTFDSIGKPLPGRESIILTRQRDYVAPAGCHVAHDLDQALARAAALGASGAVAADRAFVIGGEEIFRLALPVAGRIELTEIGIDVDGDAFFPVPAEGTWRETGREAHPESDPPFDFVTHVRTAG